MNADCKVTDYLIDYKVERRCHLLELVLRSNSDRWLESDSVDFHIYQS
jgi:hypothetical protein